MTTFRGIQLLRLLVAMAAVCMLGACASNSPAPDQLLAEAETRIEAAEDIQAGQDAPVALRTARNQLTQARQHIRAEEYAEAHRQLEKALVNADYAIVKSRSNRMEQAAEEVRRTLDTLRTELEAAQAS